MSQLIGSKCSEFYDEFNQNKTKLNWDVFNHFHEIRFQIEEQRERYFSFDGMESLEDKSNDIEDTFRDPNLLIAIKDMQHKLETALNDIQSKLYQMNFARKQINSTQIYFLLNQEQRDFLIMDFQS